MESIKEKLKNNLDFFIRTGFPTSNLSSTTLKFISEYEFTDILVIKGTLVDTGEKYRRIISEEQYELLYHILEAFKLHFKIYINTDNISGDFNIAASVKKWFDCNSNGIPFNGIQSINHKHLLTHINNDYKEYQLKKDKKELTYESFLKFMDFYSTTYSNTFTTLEIKKMLRNLNFYVTNDVLKEHINKAKEASNILVKKYGSSYNIYELCKEVSDLVKKTINDLNKNVINKEDCVKEDKTKVGHIKPFDPIVSIERDSVNANEFFDKVLGKDVKFYNRNKAVLDRSIFMKYFNKHSRSNLIEKFNDCLVLVLYGNFSDFEDAKKILLDKEFKEQLKSDSYFLVRCELDNGSSIVFVIDVYLFEFDDTFYNLSDVCRSVVKSLVKESKITTKKISL